jgi:DNA-binding response OmpR family regulator
VPPVEEVATLVVCYGDRPTLDQLSERLADDRFKVLPAPTAPDALRLCRFNHPDMLILDLALPDMEAIDLIGQIREADGVDGPTRVFSKDELLRDVWGAAAPPGRTRTLDSHASRLRRKLDPDETGRFVINTWGVGYGW